MKPEQIADLQRQLAEAQEAIRELNNRAASHLISAQNTIQKVCLERDQALAKLRKPEFFHDCVGTNNGIGKITAPQKL